LRFSSIVLGRGFLTLNTRVIYRQLAVFINNEIAIPTKLHLRNLTTPAAQPPAFREGQGDLALARLAAVPWGRDVRYFAY
jgi:hypothetical protein